MSPDLSSASRGGLVALLAAVICAAGMTWWRWSDQPQVDERLAAAKTAAAKIAGKEPLRARVERQRAANVELRANIAELKAQAGFTTAERFRVPPTEKEKGKFFLNRFVDVRQNLRDQAVARRIESDERLGFPPDNRVPPDEEAQELLDMLQLTEKALNVVLAAPDPVEWFDISHGKPYETGPVSRPALLKEYPLTLKVRGSLKTVLWILHSYGTRSALDYPLILRGLTITSDNNRVRDDVQQLQAEFELAGMAFLADTGRAPSPAASHAGSGGAMKARP
jgi:hypothetical protein